MCDSVKEERSSGTKRMSCEPKTRVHSELHGPTGRSHFLFSRPSGQKRAASEPRSSGPARAEPLTHSSTSAGAAAKVRLKASEGSLFPAQSSAPGQTCCFWVDPGSGTKLCSVDKTDPSLQSPGRNTGPSPGRSRSTSSKLINYLPVQRPQMLITIVVYAG